jgi:hypothetical protein
MRSMLRPLDRGTMFRSHFGPKCRQRLCDWGNNVANVPEREVRFTEQFFDRLELLLPSERGADGTPSITDFLLIDLPRVRDQLATAYDERTLATGDPEVRVFVGSGILVANFALFVAAEADIVELFWLTIDEL